MLGEWSIGGSLLARGEGIPVGVGCQAAGGFLNSGRREEPEEQPESPSGRQRAPAACEGAEGLVESSHGATPAARGASSAFCLCSPQDDLQLIQGIVLGEL